MFKPHKEPRIDKVMVTITDELFLKWPKGFFLCRKTFLFCVILVGYFEDHQSKKLRLTSHSTPRLMGVMNDAKALVPPRWNPDLGVQLRIAALRKIG